MTLFRFMPVGETGGYVGEYVVIYRGRGRPQKYRVTWREDGTLKLPWGAREVGDALYLAFCEWLEERYPLESMRAALRYGLQIPLETPKRWH